MAVATAAAVITLAVVALSAGERGDTASPSAEPVTATDFCFVESMIFYRVESSYLADALLMGSEVSPEAREFAEALVADDTEKLDEGFRPWYVSWKEFRPLQPAVEGPCAGHGNHRQMPGMPTDAQWDALIDADGAVAERLFAEYLIAQDQAMIEFARQVLETEPHPRVRESATAVIEDAEREIAALEGLLAGPR
jgi:uncharacterized protein (DUF305 family)